MLKERNCEQLLSSNALIILAHMKKNRKVYRYFLSQNISQKMDFSEFLEQF